MNYRAIIWEDDDGNLWIRRQDDSGIWIDSDYVEWMKAKILDILDAAENVGKESKKRDSKRSK